jgi:membrane protein YdbS with pleckstrin-like domain
VPISPKLLNEGETVVVDTRTHAKALLLPLLALVVIVAVATLGAVSIDALSGGVGGWILWAIVAIAIVWLVVIPFLNWLTGNYAITNRRLITRSGLVTRRGHDIPLIRISDVAYEHGLIDRVLGCGTLIISDASTHGSVVLHDIPHVEDTHRKIVELLNDLHHRHDGT